MRNSFHGELEIRQLGNQKGCLFRQTLYSISMVVRMRSTRSHRNNRRSHFALVSPHISVCVSCGKEWRAHALCLYCGSYRGRTALDMQARIDKKLKKRAEKEKTAR